MPKNKEEGCSVRPARPCGEVWAGWGVSLLFCAWEGLTACGRNKQMQPGWETGLKAAIPPIGMLGLRAMAIRSEMNGGAENEGVGGA